MPGLDMQDMEIAADACRKGAAKYLSRNPIIVWHHQANMPIGRVESLTFAEAGMYMTGVIFDMQDVLDRWRAHGKEIPLDSIALKCDEAWEGIQSGAFRGLSIRGGVREVVPAWSNELEKIVPRVLEVELYEISVTPIAVHPGTKITSINTIAKAFGEALEVCKALELQPQPCQQEGDAMSQTIKEKWDALQAAIAASADENGMVELPAEVEKGLQAYGQAIEVPPKSLEEQLQEQQEVIKGLQERLGAMEQPASPARPAERRGYASAHTPTEAKVKPTGAPASNVNVVAKALQLGSETYRGKTDFGQGERFQLPKEDIYKCALIEAQQQGHMAAGQINLSPQGHKWMQAQINA